MWLTGLDVASLSTLSRQALEAHGLTQARVRASRVHEGRSHGLVVDDCGILENPMSGERKRASW
jgi:type I site-specific restriction-modification system R (restriction) subunit